MALSVGKFSVDHSDELGSCWAKVVDLKHPSIGFAASAGLVVDDKNSLEKKRRRAKRWTL